METAPETLHFGDITMDLSAHRVTRGSTRLGLSPIEFRLLRFFLDHPCRVLSREQLLAGVWRRRAEVRRRTVDVCIRRLRRVLNKGGRPDPIRTVRTVGYVLDRIVD